MKSDIDKNMQQYINMQNEKIAMDKDYPLNDFQHKMKTSKPLTKEEKMNLKRDIDKGILQYNSEFEESDDNVTSASKEAALNYQRKIVNEIRLNKNMNKSVSDIDKLIDQSRTVIDLGIYDSSKNDSKFIFEDETNNSLRKNNINIQDSFDDNEIENVIIRKGE